MNITDWNEFGKDLGFEFTEPNLTDEQKAVATVRAFFETLIVKDYNEAARFWVIPKENKTYLSEKLEKTNVVEIVSIGEPRFPYREWARMIVPCTVAVKINGQRIEKKLDGVYVGLVLGHPNRRTIWFADTSLNALISN